MAVKVVTSKEVSKSENFEGGNSFHSLGGSVITTACCCFYSLSSCCLVSNGNIQRTNKKNAKKLTCARENAEREMCRKVTP